ncbi:MAG: DNA repair protein RecO [Candidatus Wildermuthbacteria bacterium RIFCSPHIGHO2_01_FULL_48_27b]|uniref:DNA repair protein RecO n=1 Tax=Candidatus Wildermuthbacteria bacterium RIFCSPHIGHO2_01_FULL_48_27b TaxID=1802447 RepID=A0A1G2QSZ1_9BACT|nr:MAG: DNA repair protein RecO [Candidatus Wildermuthbacteria bacterium RIFCSPHIGHO2_01_FULL_48_27b]
MAQHYRTQGIILRKQDIGEADRVFTVFTRDFGKLRLRAVSERKITSKLRGGLELFYLAEIEFIQGKVYKTITDAVCVCPYPIIRKNLERLRVMERFAQVADELLHGQEQDEEIWNLLQETLSVLNRPALKGHDLKILAYYFLWNLLASAGYSPSLAQIVAEDPSIAEFIGVLLKSDSETLQDIDLRGINETRLREISQEHLSQILQN